ncbi:MAG: nucleotidyltransferase domain-containing protein [Spirochaetales bacterium]|nr:nucleotidyltransferase domain-containing protein [Spirochaetales bacterium]
MTPETIPHIKTRLTEIETEHNVQILYAVESGSRAWGFESTDSDYDVRFIYKHQTDWYLNVFPKRDVIEYPIVDEYDYAGWDIKKTLFLMSKSNPVLFEWLRSPISSTYHYLHMARGNFREYLKRDEVRIKKFFYVLRPILACMWIEQFKESPPMEFEDLLTLIDSDKAVYNQIIDLLARKRAGKELGLEPRIDDLNRFIETKLEHFDHISKKYEKLEKPNGEFLDETFRTLLSK